MFHFQQNYVPYVGVALFPTGWSKHFSISVCVCEQWSVAIDSDIICFLSSSKALHNSAARVGLLRCIGRTEYYRERFFNRRCSGRRMTHRINEIFQVRKCKDLLTVRSVIETIEHYWITIPSLANSWNREINSNTVNHWLNLSIK